MFNSPVSQALAPTAQFCRHLDTFTAWLTLSHTGAGTRQRGAHSAEVDLDKATAQTTVPTHDFILKWIKC